MKERRFFMVRQEWKNLLHNTWFKIVMVAILALPCIYAGVFLGSMWDPYGNVDKIPVAIVNQDQEVNYNNQKLAVGQELVKNLKKDRSMDYHFVNQKKAQEGLRAGDYYMIVSIPKDFSKNATTLLDKHPEQMTLSYITNPGSNYVASKMDDTAVTKMKEEVSHSITKTYAETLFSQVSTLSKGLSDAAQGSEQIAEGSTKLLDANALINENLNVLANSVLRFEDGVSFFQTGLQQYTDGVVQVNQGALSLRDGLSQLNQAKGTMATGIAQLNSGAVGLQEGIKQYSDATSQAYDATQVLSNRTPTLLAGVNQVSSATQTLHLLNTQMNEALKNYKVHMASGDLNAEQQDMATIEKLQQNISVVSQNLDASMNGGMYYVIKDGNVVLDANGTPLTTTIGNDQTLSAAMQAYTTGVGQVNDGLQQITSKNNALVQGSQQLSQGLFDLQMQYPGFTQAIERLYQGANTLQLGSQGLVNHNPSLLSGSQSIFTGSSQMANGASHLAQGSSAMQDGLASLHEGSQALTTSLQEGAQKSALKTNDKNNEMFAKPVGLSHSEISVVDNNGHAMAPYMMSVALYVACLSFALMYPLLKDVEKAKSGFRYWLSKASIWFFISSLAAILMIATLMWLNGFAPQQTFMTFFFAIVVAAAFMSLITLLSMTCGKIGEFVLLVFMVINLGGSAGVYPLETSSKIYQVIHPYLPFTYSVNGFRKVISSVDASIASELLFFVMLLLVCSVITIIVYQKRVKKPALWIPQAFEENE